jgi:hypothetical protein
MKQIAKATQLFTDKLKSYIVVGLIVVLIPSFAVGENLFPKKETENIPTVPTENVVPKTQPPKTDGPPPYGTIFMLNKPVACNDTPVLMNYIRSMNQMVPITMGRSVNPMGAIVSLVQVYANPISEQFAVVEHFAIQKSCIIFQGQNFDIILPDRYYEGSSEDED